MLRTCVGDNCVRRLADLKLFMVSHVNFCVGDNYIRKLVDLKLFTESYVDFLTLSGLILQTMN